MERVPIGIGVTSDRAASGNYDYLAGPAVAAYLGRANTTPWKPRKAIVRDERGSIADALILLEEVDGCPLILLSGSTGPAPRNASPDVMEDVCRHLEGMPLANLKEAPNTNFRGRSVAFALAGTSSACPESATVFAAVSYCTIKSAGRGSR